ncbi:MAG: NACHT domain-containing protein [Candidatus Aminicenantes bacterium]|nr:NACHT domain-containing protein [Candidatus Aminicenantes bacterium]
MAELETLQGILALIDVVNFTGQAEKLGHEFTGKFTEYFQKKIKTMVERRGFHAVKNLGDAVLIFGTDPQGIIDIMKDLFDRDKPEDKHGFKSRFRMVGHSGYFQFQMEGDTPVDLVSAEGVKIFRMEKHALAWELVVTHELYQGIKALLNGENIDANRMHFDKPLKGFDNDDWRPPFYKLSIRTEQTGVSNILERRMAQLEQDVQTIPVFGKIYPPVPMEKNFINLALVCDNDEVNADDCRTPGEDFEEIRGDREAGLKKRKVDEIDDWIHYKYRGGRRSSDFKEIDVNKLYEKHKQGIIFGLPGAGKTTILRHLAFKEFNANKTKEERAKQVVLFVPCRDIPFYDDWYKKRTAEDKAVIDQHAALEYMAWVFLFGNKQEADLMPGQLVDFQDAYKQVKQAFDEKRLTLLVDALDEAPNRETKERIRQLFCALISENRLYLTSRPSERVHLKIENIKEFNVLSLEMDQVRNIARHLMEENSDVYKQFDEAIWQEEIVVKMAATPMTALLVTAYFQAYGKFDHRFPMYDLLVKFILLNVWEKIKTASFQYDNLELFFKVVKEPDFLEKNKETQVLYDSLALLCFGIFYDGPKGKVRRSVNEDTLRLHFSDFIEEKLYYHDKDKSDLFASRWLEQLQRDHILIQAGPSEYMFVHSTVMEYLAAYYLVEQRRRREEKFVPLLQKSLAGEDYLELETVPIAAGGDMLSGYKIAAVIRDLEPSYPRERLFEFGVKCLAELEWLTEKTLRSIQIERLKAPFQQVITTHRPSVAWIYEGLKERILSADKEALKKAVKQFDRQLRLCRGTLLEKYLDYDAFQTGDSEMVELRKQLLKGLVQEELVGKWLKGREGLKEEIGNILRLDSPQYDPEDKNFKYYRGLVGSELAGFFGSPNLKHSGSVRACAFLPDGKRVVSASEDNTLKLWDVETGKEIRCFSGHTDSVLSCAALPDGRRVVSASADNTLKLWDVETGKTIRTFSGHTASVYSCAALPDGRRLVSASYDNTLKLWDVETGKTIRTFSGHQGSVYSCAATADGRRVVSASLDKTVKLWDVETGKTIRTFSGHTDSVRSCAATPDGRRVVSSSADKTVKLWDVETGKEIRTFSGHTDSVLSCAALPDGRRVVSASEDKTLKLWDVETGKEIRTFSGHTAYVNSCAATPDGRRVVSASYDKTVKLWDVETGKTIRTFSGHTAPVWSCAATPDSRRVVSASRDNTVKLWDVETGKTIRSFSGHTSYVNSCAALPDGRRIVSSSADNTVKLWDVETGKTIRTFSGHTDSVLSCAATPDGRRVVSSSADKTVKLWDMETGKEIRTFSGHTDSVLSCAALPDGRRVVSASYDKTVKLWDVETGKTIRTFSGHTSSVYSCAALPDGRRLISASYDKTLKLWDIESGQCLKTLSLPWIPQSIAISSAQPTQPAKVFTANRNGTVTMFEFEELK